MQLLDGYGETPMKAGKFAAIVDQTIKALPELAAAPLSVEFAPGNQGLHLYQIGAVQRSDTDLIVGLQDKAAMCKPSVLATPEATSSECCGKPRAAACC